LVKSRHLEIALDDCFEVGMAYDLIEVGKSVEITVGASSP
jgi:hypothetical protein